MRNLVDTGTGKGRRNAPGTERKRSLFRAAMTGLAAIVLTASYAASAQACGFNICFVP